MGLDEMVTFFVSYSLRYPGILLSIFLFLALSVTVALWVQTLILLRVQKLHRMEDHKTIDQLRSQIRQQEQNITNLTDILTEKIEGLDTLGLIKKLTDTFRLSESVASVIQQESDKPEDIQHGRPR